MDDSQSGHVIRRLQRNGPERASQGQRQARRYNCYSTKEIVAAIYGDMRGEQLRRLREDADNIALKNKALRTELVPLGEVQSAVAAILSALEQLSRFKRNNCSCFL